MLRFLKFLTAMVSTYHHWLQVLAQRQELLKKYENSGSPQLPRSRSTLFPPGWPHEYVVEHALAEILVNQKQILKNQEEAKLKASEILDKLSDLSSTVDEFIADNSGGVSDADSDKIGAAIDSIKAKLVAPATQQ